MFEVSDVEHRYNELYVGIMANAVHRRLSTRFTECTFVCRSLRMRWSSEIHELLEYTVVDAQDGDQGHHLLQAIGQSQCTDLDV